MSITYELNPNGARAATISSRIVEKGAYAGRFTIAQAITARSGSQGIEFSFKADSGATADYLTLWTHNADGKELYGRKVLDAILTCLKVRKIAAVSRPIQRRTSGGGTETVKADVFPDLMGKPVGLFLVSEEYEKTDGSLGSKMVIVLPFDPATRKTASEILDQREAQAFDGILASLRDRPARKRERSAAPMEGVSRSGGFDDMDDDIPFE